MLDSLIEIYSISRSIADQLFEINSDFFAYYNDDSSRRKASSRASVAHLYYPYDYKYSDNHIYILEARGLRSEAEAVRNKMQELPRNREMLMKFSC